MLGSSAPRIIINEAVRKKPNRVGYAYFSPPPPSRPQSRRTTNRRAKKAAGAALPPPPPPAYKEIYLLISCAARPRQTSQLMPAHTHTHT